MMLALSKKFWLVSAVSFVIFGILSFKIHDSYRQTANIVSAIQGSPTPSLTETLLLAEDTQKLNPPKNVDLIGIAVAGMTYGRIRVRNLTPNTSFSYFIAEPDDVIEDGALRYSPTTRNIGDEPIKITGKMTDRCYWNDAEYFGCVPWVEIEKIEKLSGSFGPKVQSLNNFNDLRWWTNRIQEKNLHAEINIEYPQFIGGDEVAALNKYIQQEVFKRLEYDRGQVKKWIAERTYWEDTCGQEPVQGTIWPCSVQLASEYKVAGIVNDILSTEINFIDYTGGGNGNHEDPIVINWDLKTNKQLGLGDIFCDKSYISKLYPLALESVLGQFTKNTNWSLDDSLLKDIRERISNPENYTDISINRNGISIVFGPYDILSGAAGIVRTPISYSSIPDVVCLP